MEFKLNGYILNQSFLWSIINLLNVQLVSIFCVKMLFKCFFSCKVNCNILPTFSWKKYFNIFAIVFEVVSYHLEDGVFLV